MLYDSGIKTGGIFYQIPCTLSIPLYTTDTLDRLPGTVLDWGVTWDVMAVLVAGRHNVVPLLTGSRESGILWSDMAWCYVHLIRD